jgi:hypothetical protein
MIKSEREKGVINVIEQKRKFWESKGAIKKKIFNY